MGKRARKAAPAAEEAVEGQAEEQVEEKVEEPEAKEPKKEPKDEEDQVGAAEAAEDQDADEGNGEEQQQQHQQLVEAEPPMGAPAAAVVEDKRGRPRLMIREIVLENFKSYGGRKLIGPFNKSFSSIVGPNGSGKSNTIDALLFVFGKRAKKMRLNKVSELIHNSGAMRDCQSAKVSVTFQDIVDTGAGPEDYRVVEGTVLTVSREAFRNNQSKYYVDGRGSNFTEVTALLMKRGVDLEHNRFLILQGEVEQISLMKPKAGPNEDGLLEYLEDIIGSNRYVEPIEQAEKDVETLTEQRQEKLNRLRVAEREREALDGPRKEAEAWVTAEGERLECLALLSQAEAWRAHSSIGKMEAEKKKLEAHMEEHKKRMEIFEKQVKAIEAEHNTQLKEHTAVKTQMEKASAEFQEFERQDVKFQTDIECTEQKLKKQQDTAEKEEEAAQKFLDDAEDLRQKGPLKEKELESSERFKAAQAQKLEKIYAGLKDKAEELRPLKEKKEAELVPLQKKLTDVRKVVEVAQTEAQLLREKTSKAEEEKQEVQRQLTECSEKLTSREKEAKDAGRLREDRKKLVADAEIRMKEIGSQVDALAPEVAARRTKAEEARSSFEQEHHRSRLITAVYAQSKSGHLKGVHGRLGDLGTIHKKYDVAVSTACGMLDAIVVDTTEDAQALIEFIRKNDLGRATCICLQKIKDKQYEADQEVQTPENAPRLIDLIKPSKPEYKVAFFFAVHHTLVAKDLEQATRVGLKGRSRWRVVTLEGQLIDTSGTMSGGGGQVAKGGMKSSACMYSPEEVRDIVQGYEQANTKLSGLRQEKRALEEAVELTKKEISEFELAEQKCVMDVGSLKKQVDAYETRLASLKIPTMSSGDKSKLKELEKLVSSRSNELNKIQQKHQAVEEEVRDLHNQIMNIGGEELKEAKKAMDDATKKCEDLRRFIKKAGLDIENFVKNSKKAKENAKKAREAMKSTEKALAQLKEEHAKLDDKAEAVLKVYEELKAQLEEKDATLTTLRAKRDEVIAQASAQKNQEVDLWNELESMTRALRDHQARIQSWGQKLQEARKEYEQLPLTILAELRQAQAEGGDGAAPSRAFSHLARRAVKTELKEEELKTVMRQEVEALLASLESNLKNLKPNLASIEEFRRADAEHKTRLAEYEDVHGQREELRRKLEQLKQSRLEEFMEGFSVISMKLKEMYQMITLGGDAELELVDTLDPFSEGVSFSVRPPKKSWKQITNLSGGEKTLASLSLVFALHHYKPTPLYFMDEIDAALDFRNVSIIANYIKERTKNAQFIVISLRNHMFEMADLLVGIYKTHDVSKSVAVDPLAFSVSPKAPLQDVSISVAGNNSREAPMPLEAPPPVASGKGKRPVDASTAAAPASGPKRRAVRGKEN